MFIAFQDRNVIERHFSASDRGLQVPIPAVPSPVGSLALADVLPLLAPYDGPLRPYREDWSTVSSRLSKEKGLADDREPSGVAGGGVDGLKAGCWLQNRISIGWMSPKTCHKTRTAWLGYSRRTTLASDLLSA